MFLGFTGASDYLIEDEEEMNVEQSMMALSGVINIIKGKKTFLLKVKLDACWCLYLVGFLAVKRKSKGEPKGIKSFYGENFKTRLDDLVQK